MIKLAHIITTLDTGGAEMMLYKLLSRMKRARFHNTVIVLARNGSVGEKIAALDIPVHALHLRRGVPNPLAVLKLARVLRRLRPEVIQTWMYHADLLGGLANQLATRAPLAWGIRHSNLEPQYNKRSTLLVAKLCARFSRVLPARIVCNSEIACTNHIAFGYEPSKMLVLPNGFDLAAFQPDAQARIAVRRELGLHTETLLIGLVGRFDPQKDHRNFIEAAGRLHKIFPAVHFVLCGERITRENEDLRRWIKAAAIETHCHVLGRREDIPRLTAAFDIATSASVGEAFPNVIGEAMACGVPCVVTEVGDSARLVGDTGRVVPVRDAAALAESWCELLALKHDARAQLGLAARARVQAHFALDVIVQRFEEFYESMAQLPRMKN